MVGAIGPPVVYYHSSTPLHHINSLNCAGTELNILDCPYNLSNSDCSNGNDANVFCECMLPFSFIIAIVMSL